MERLRVIRSFNGELSQFPHKPNLRDASFSSYLPPVDHQPTKTHEDELRCTTIHDSEISIFDAQKYFNETNDDHKLVTNRVSPIVVNNENLDRTHLSSSVPRFSSASSVDGCGGNGRNYRNRSFHATPTASSEASWNSQTGLLSHPPGAISVNLRNPVSDQKKRGSWFFRRKCPCSGKKSVQVEDKQSEPKSPSVRSSITKNPPVVMNSKIQTTKPELIGTITADRAASRSIRLSPENRIQPNQIDQRVLATGSSGFSFPILNQSASKKIVLNNNIPPAPLEDPPRDSLEVYRPPSDEPISIKSTEIQQRIEKQSFTFSSSPKHRIIASITDDDVASDASSDLFEIESFSTQTTSYHMYQHRRDSLDEASNFNARRLSSTAGSFICRRSIDDDPPTPSIAPTECYEPSEASIDWSVTTAEGFDKVSVTNFSVTASEVADFTLMRQYEEERSGNVGGRRRGNGLLGCRCEKAVSVGPHPVRYVAADGHTTAVPPLMVSSTSRHVGSRAGMVNRPPVITSRSPRLSLAFAT